MHINSQMFSNAVFCNTKTCFYKTKCFTVGVEAKLRQQYFKILHMNTLTSSPIKCCRVFICKSQFLDDVFKCSNEMFYVFLF